MFRNIVIIFLLSFLHTVLHAQQNDLKLKKSAVHFNVSAEGKFYTCLLQSKVYIPGKISRDKKKFTPLKAEIHKKVLKLKQKIRTYPDKKKHFKGKIKTLNNSVKAAQAMCSTEYIRLNTPSTPTPEPEICFLIAENNSFQVIENSTTGITLQYSTNCNNELNYEITSPPAQGEVYTENGSMFYHAAYGDYKESFNARICYTASGLCSEPVTLEIEVKSAEFSGNYKSYKPYRNTITYSEARHLIKKLALNDFTLLTDDLKSGTGYSLEALVNKMLSAENVAGDLKGQLDVYTKGVRQPLKGAWNETFFNPVAEYNSPASQVQGFELLEDHYLRSRNINFDPYRVFYSNSKTTASPVLRARYLSPSRELMNNIWYGHFGVAMHNFGSYDSENHIRDYMRIIQNNSLGSFKDMIIGVNPEACKSEGEGRGILCDAASNLNLNNESNIYNAKNQNFAREFLELFLLGPLDPVTGAPNYSEADVEAATAFLSGYKKIYYTGALNDGPAAGGAVRREKLIWDPTRHDFSELVAFRGTDYEIRGPLTPVEFAEHIFDNHPGMPRFIAAKLFRMLAHRNPSAELIGYLASRFKNSGFNIGDLVYAIAVSEAMFSSEAATPGCIKEPFRLLTETTRNFSIPMLTTYPVNSGSSNHFAQMGIYTADKIVSTMRNMGETPLMYPTIFSHDYCGRAADQYGEEWLFSVYMLNRIKAPVAFMSQAFWANNGFYGFNKYFKDIIMAGESVFNATPSRVIEYFNKTFGVTLDQREYEIIYEYLTTTLDENDKPAESGWNPSSAQLIEEKLSGLTAIYSSMSQSNVH